MELTVRIPKIRCNKDTFEIGADEIYFLLLVSSVNSEAGSPAETTKFYASVSEVKSGVTEDVQWVPDLNNVTVDIGDANLVSVMVALFEKDDGVIYDKLLANPYEHVKPDGFILPLPDDLTLGAAIKWLLKLSWNTFKYFKQDDPLGEDGVVANVSDPNLPLPREFKFKKFGYDYHMMVDLSVA